MSIRRLSILGSLFAAGVLLAALAGSAGAAESTPGCARTNDPNAPAAPTPGAPCWIDVTPYPFGYDGNPVDASTPFCQPNPASCYLQVDSMAFRAWNRGIASVSSLGQSATTPFGVWLFNGARWFPDPTFPGQSVCKGNTVVWAGKLDYWLVGERNGAGNWPRLCRFDGVSFQWEPLAVPAATIAHFAPGTPGWITAGACIAWNDCWFFGTGGVVVHWDGQSLRDVPGGLGASPWLQDTYTSAVARTRSDATTFGVAVTDYGATSQPDGSPAPQLFGSTGGPFSALSSSPSSLGATDPTDFVAIDFNAAAQGWVAGDPQGTRPRLFISNQPGPAQASPLVRISSTGGAQSCPGTPPGTFTLSDGPDSYLWSTVSVMPQGDAIAAGQFVGSQIANTEPVLARVSCDQPPTIIRFRVPDPTARNPNTAPLIPADEGGYMTATAANAINDAWAATTPSALNVPNTPQIPHLYRLTDTQAPLAPAGDDNELRPLVFQPEPTIFQIAPPVVIPPPPLPTTITTQGKPKARRLRSPIYDVRRPRLARAANGKFALAITFKVRRKVTIGLEGLRRGKVVSSSGLKTFSGNHGTLVLILNPHHWPTRLKFVLARAQP